MNVVITGAAGFLGTRLCDELLREGSLLPVRSLLLVDAVAPPPRSDPRVSTLALDLAAPGAADRAVQADTHVLFHLAAVVSGQAEADFELGLRVNLDATRALAEAARRRNRALRIVFTSTVGVFGGELPPVVGERTAVTPQSSYGAAKAMCELLLLEYERRGFADARVVRLPTVSVRAGGANAAVTSFASGVVREPLAGRAAVCPVPAAQALWVASPRAAVRNLAHAAALAPGALGGRALNLPGVRVTVAQMVAALREVAGEDAAALVRFERDELIASIVASFPAEFDNTRALRLGFVADTSFTQIIRDYMTDDLKRSS